MEFGYESYNWKLRRIDIVWCCNINFKPEFDIDTDWTESIFGGRSCRVLNLFLMKLESA